MAVAVGEQGNQMLDAHQLMWTQIAAGISVLLFGLMLFNLVRMVGPDAGRAELGQGRGHHHGLQGRSAGDARLDDQNDARPIIRYRYHVGGQELEGDKVFVGGITMTTGVLAENWPDDIRSAPMSTSMSIRSTRPRRCWSRPQRRTSRRSWRSRSCSASLPPL